MLKDNYRHDKSEDLIYLYAPLVNKMGADRD